MKAIIYKGKDKKWYAKIIARNGRNVWDTGDGYSRKAGVLKAVKLIGITNIKFK